MHRLLRGKRQLVTVENEPDAELASTGANQSRSLAMASWTASGSSTINPQGVGSQAAAAPALLSR